MSDEMIIGLFSDLADKMKKEIKKSEKNMKAEIEKSEKNMKAEIEKSEKNMKMELNYLRKEMNQKFDKVDERFDTVNLNMAKLEHVMYERTDILFDAYKGSEEADQNLKSEIKSLDNRLDYYGGKIYKLESKKN